MRHLYVVAVVALFVLGVLLTQTYASPTGVDGPLINPF